MLRSAMRAMLRLAAIACLAALCCARPGPAGGPTLDAFRYGVSPDMDWLFYLYRGGGRVVLIDCGFTDEAAAQSFGVKLEAPRALVAKAGIRASQVTDVVLTHGHFDHLGTLPDWPKARIWIHRDALDALPEQPFSDAANRFITGNRRVRPFTGDLSPFDGFEIRSIGRHSPGSCIVSISLPGRRRAILVGDEYRTRADWKAAAAGGQDGLALELEEDERRGNLVLTMHETPRIPGAGSGPAIRLYPAFRAAADRGKKEK